MAAHHSPAMQGSLENPGGLSAEFIRNKRIWRVVRLEQVKKDATVLQWTDASMDLSGGMPVMDSMTAKNRMPFRWRLRRVGGS